MTRGALGGAVLIVLGLANVASAAADGKLFDAVKRHDRAAVQALLKSGADVNGARPDGATVLHWAAYDDDQAMVETLVRAGANANAVNELGIAPLHLACGNGSAPMVELLLKAGANPNGGPAGQETPVMTAARVGVPAVMKLLLAKGGDPNATEEVRGQTALMWAAAQRHPEVVQLLLASGAKVQARTKVPPKRTPMRGAGAPANSGVGGGNGGNGGNVNFERPDGSNGFTALLFAARVGDVESARLLLERGADANDTAADGMSALVISTIRGFPKFAMFLLDRGASANANGTGYTALHWAAGTWESELTVRAITTEREGEWFTIAGLKEGKLALVKALLAHGADPNARMMKAPPRAGSSKNPSLPELEGATPLILAAMAGDAAVMKALVAAGADPTLRTTKTNGTLLMAAAGFGHVQGEDLVKDADARAAAEAALEMGQQIDELDSTGNTALHYAAYMRHDSVVQLLADRGASLHVKNKFGETPLWTAELVIQFMAGGTYQLIPSSTGDLLRKLGALRGDQPYGRARPADWPSNPRAETDQVGMPEVPKADPAKKQ